MSFGLDLAGDGDGRVLSEAQESDQSVGMGAKEKTGDFKQGAGARGGKRGRS